MICKDLRMYVMKMHVEKPEGELTPPRSGPMTLHAEISNLPLHEP